MKLQIPWHFRVFKALKWTFMGLNLERIYIFYWHSCIPVFNLDPQMHRKSIKQSPSRFRIVADTEYITNLFHKFCALHLLFSSRNLHLEQRKYILQNWKCFSFILQKLKDPISSLCHLKKPMCGDGMWCIFNIYVHFSVPAIFVQFVYLDVFCFTQFCFDEYVIYFNFWATLLWLFIWHIWNLEMYALTS